MTEVRHENPHDPDTTPKIQHSGDLGLEQPFLDENGEPAFGTNPINENHLGDPDGIASRLNETQQADVDMTAAIVFGPRENTTDSDKTGAGKNPDDGSDVEDTVQHTFVVTEESSKAPETSTDQSRQVPERGISRRGIIGIIGGVVLGGAVVGGAVYAATRPQSQPVTPSASPTPSTPATSETAPAKPELPFDPEQVAKMRQASVAEFYERDGQFGRMARIQYVLSGLYNEANVSSRYTSKLDQTLSRGETLSDYNPFTTPLNRKADRQDVMNNYLFGVSYAMAHDDPEEGIKMLSAYIADSDSDIFKDWAQIVIDDSGKVLAQKDLRDQIYTAEKFKYSDGANGERLLDITTVGKYRYVFEFVPVENLAQPPSDDEAGMWLLRTSQQIA